MLKQIVLLFIFFVPVLHAADVDHLYQSEVLVADQSQQERNRAITEGFRQVLVKVTGNRNIGQSRSLAAVFSKASRYVQQYRYRLETDETGQQEVLERRYLRITFDKQAIDRALRENGFPVWGKSRPQTIAWVGFDNGGKRKLLMPEFDQGVIKILNRAAESRGIPLLFPVMDLQDQSAISASELWGAFEQPVNDASRRYQADEILTIRIKSGSNGFFSTSWSLQGNGTNREWDLSGKSLGTTLQQGIETLSDYLADSYAPVGGADAQVVYMQVSALNTFADLVRVESFLKSQDTVQGFQLRQSQADKCIFSLSLRGGMQAFTQAVELSGLFQVEDMMFAAPLPVPEPVSVSAVALDQALKEDITRDETPADVEDLNAEIKEAAPESTIAQMPVAVSRDPLSDIQLYYRLR